MQEASPSLGFGAVGLRLFSSKLGSIRNSMRPSVRRSKVKMGEDVVERGCGWRLCFQCSKFEAGPRPTRDTPRRRNLSPLIDVT